MHTTRRWVAVGALIALALPLGACSSGGGTKTVTAVDYHFQNLPSSVKSGTTFSLRNDSTKELHEMVLIPIPDQERRSIDELLKLPEAELDRAVPGEPAMVLIRPPGNTGPVIKAAGNGKVTKKGRYAVICAIPLGADPQAYLQAAQSSQGGPPNVAGGPPHFTQGMYGQVTVK